jgi:2-oxoisovalerate dehydrogenase E2 component (dihydrolipoyl transacylase)
MVAIIDYRFVKKGDKVEQFTPICEVQSDKAAVDISSRYDGVILELHYKPGETAKVGSALVDIDTGGETENVPNSASTKSLEPIETTSCDITSDPVGEPNVASEAINMSEVLSSLTLATPAVRRIAKEHSINLTNVKGSGPNGRVLKGDVLKFVELKADYKPEIISAMANDKVVHFNPIQKAMFKAMTKSLAIPHFGFSDEICIDSLLKDRKSINFMLLNETKYSFKKISLMPFFLKAMSVALLDFPILNACVQINESGNPELLYRSAHNISIAMDTPNG